MITGSIAALVALLALGFVEALGRFYPARRTWLRLRATYGYQPLRAMRERFEAAGSRKTGRRVGIFLLALVVAWIAASSLLDKRWYEVVLDVLPYAIVLLALLRTPWALRAVAERMKDYERQAGHDPDARPTEGDGPGAMAL